MAKTKNKKPDDVPEVGDAVKESDLTYHNFIIGEDVKAGSATPTANPVTDTVSSILIKPTIGRMVLYKDGFSDQFCAAQIAYVHDDCHINIGYLDRYGLPQSKENVFLANNESSLPCLEGQCEWMEYQKKK